MKRWINVVSQVVLGLGQIVNLAAPLLSENQKLKAAVVLGALSLVVSVVAHEFNPDGTKAREPYTKDSNVAG